jgi:hypothetical protein
MLDAEQQHTVYRNNKQDFPTPESPIFNCETKGTKYNTNQENLKDVLTECWLVVNSGVRHTSLVQSYQWT